MSDNTDAEIYDLSTGRMIDAKRVRRPRTPSPPAPPRHRPDLRPPDEREPFTTLQLRAGISNEDGAALCGVTRRQWQRWRNGTSRVPVTVRRLLACYAGEPASLDKAWRGYVFRADRLHAPNGENISARELEHLHVFRQQEAALEERAARLEFWADVNGRAEQVRMARAFGAIDAAAVMLVQLRQVLDDCPNDEVRRAANDLTAVVSRLFDAEARLSRIAHVEESR